MLKISFPMPMWRQPTDDTTPVSQLESPSENETPAAPPAPTVYLSSKAEKLLGGPESRGLNKKFAVRKTKKQQPARRKSSSFMDVVIADAAIGDTPSPIDTADTVSSPDSHIAASQSLQPPPISRLHRHGSSPLLGELARQSKLSGSPNVDYFSARHGSAPDASAPAPPTSTQKKKSQLMGTVHHRPIERVATVMDAFDAPPGQRRPSQTPSERSQPRTPRTPLTPGSPAFSDKSSRKPSSASDVSFKSRASSKARLSTMPRFRQASQASQASQSSQEAPTSNPEPQSATEPVSEITNKQHHYNSHRWFHRSKGSNPGYVPPIPAHQVTNPRFSSVKVNVRRPRPGTHHWFDAVEEDEFSAESPESEEPPESVNAAPGYYHYLLTAKEEPLSPPLPQPTQPLQHSPKQRPASAVRHSNLPKNRQQRSSVRRSHQPQTTTELMGPRQVLADHLQRLSVARSVSPNVRVPLATSPPVAPVAEKPHAEEINLHMESVLSLSSSDDEKDGCKAATVARADVGDEVLAGGHVPRVPARRARPRANTQQSLTPPPAQQRPTWDPATTALPPTPPTPSHSAPPATAPRNSSLRWRHTMNNATSNKPGPFPISNALRAEPATIMEDVSSSFRPQTTVKSSLVTSDDEKLLGAMREKRASLRQQAATAAGHHGFERRGSLPVSPGTQYQQKQQSPISQQCTSPPLLPPMLTPAVYTGPLSKRGGANSSNSSNRHKRVSSSVSGSSAHPKNPVLNVATSHRVSLRLRRMSRSMDDLSLCNQQEEEEEQLRANEDAFGSNADINAIFPAPPSKNRTATATATIPISFSADVGTTHSATSSGTNSTIRPFSLQPQAYGMSSSNSFSSSHSSGSKAGLLKQSRQESTSSATSANRPPSLVSSSGRPSVSSPASASDNSTSPSTPSTGNTLPLTPPMPPFLAMGIKSGSSGSYSSQGSGSFSSSTPDGLIVSNSDASLSSRHYHPHSHHRQQKSLYGGGSVAMPPCPYPPPSAPVPLPPTFSSASPSPSATRASSASPMQQLPYARPPFPPPQPSKSPAPSIASTSTTRSFRSASSSPAPPGKLTTPTGSSGSIRTRSTNIADVPRRDSPTSAAAAAGAAIAASSSSSSGAILLPSPLKKARGSVLARAHPAFLQQENTKNSSTTSTASPAVPVTRPLPPHRRSLSTTKIDTNVPPAGKSNGSPSSPIKRGRELAYAQFHASRRASNGSSPPIATGTGTATATANTAPLNIKKASPAPIVTTTGMTAKVGGGGGGAQAGKAGGMQGQGEGEIVSLSPPPPEVPQRSTGHRYHSSLDEQERIAERERKVEEEDIIGWALKTY